MFSSPAAILFTTVALDLIGFGLVVPLMPLYARNFDVSPQAIAWLLASYSLMQFFFAPLWGKLSDRVGRRPVLLASMAGNFAALLAFATAGSFTQLFASRVLAGVCTANISVASAYMADITPPEQRARGMGLIGAAFGLGFVLGPFLAGELSTYGLGAPFYAAALLAALNGLLAYVRLPESLPPSRREGPSAQESITPWALLLGRWRSAQGRRRVKQLLVLIFCHVFGFAMMEMALTLVVATRLGYGPMQSGRLLAYVGLVLVVVQGGLVGRLSRRFGDGPLFVTGLAILGLGLGATGAAALVGLGPMLLALGLIALGQGLVAPTGSALLSRSADAASQGEVLGLGQSCSALARVCGPLIAGTVYQQLGDVAPFFVGGAMVLLAGLSARTWFAKQDSQRLSPSFSPNPRRPCSTLP